jgi:hypothetical protein
MTDLEQLIAPDERAVREHLRAARFQAGVDARYWRLVAEVAWPHALIAVSAAARPGAPSEFLLFFELNGYPLSAPTAGPWDADTNALLDAARRPKGERAGHVFRADWENGRALYAPWDRVALEGHPGWAAQYPRFAWNAKRDLAFYLENVHEILTDGDYVGI